MIQTQVFGTKKSRGNNEIMLTTKVFEKHHHKVRQDYAPNRAPRLSKRHRHSHFGAVVIMAPLIIILKIILQYIWEKGLTRDDHLPKEKRKSFQAWSDHYVCPSPIEIPRCLTLDIYRPKFL